MIVDSDRDTDSHCDSQSRSMGGQISRFHVFAPRAIKTSSQGSFLLIDVRSDEKTARRAAVIVLARNADKHTGHAKRAC